MSAEVEGGGGTAILADTETLRQVAGHWLDLMPILGPSPEIVELPGPVQWTDPASRALSQATADWEPIDLDRTFSGIWQSIPSSRGSTTHRRNSSSWIKAVPTGYPTLLGRGWSEAGMSTPPPRTVLTPGMPGYVAYVIKQGWWPQADPATVEKWAATHQDYGLKLTEAANALELTYGPLFYELLQGKAGQALQTSLNKIVKSWRYEAAKHQSAATALSHAADYLRGLRVDLTDIIDANGPAYDTAVKRGHVAAANTIVDKAADEANAATDHARDRITAAVYGQVRDLSG